MRRKTRKTKNEWFAERADELQHAADRKGRKIFSELIKELYCLSSRGSAPLLSKDYSTLLSDSQDRLLLWKEHYSDLLNLCSHHCFFNHFFSFNIFLLCFCILGCFMFVNFYVEFYFHYL